MKKEDLINQNFETQIPSFEKKPPFWERPLNKLKSLNRKYLLIGVGVSVLLVIVLFLMFSSYRIQQFNLIAPPEPTPTPFEEVIINPSAYATDSAILETESKLKEIEKTLGQTDLKETGLNPPILDMEVNFEK